LEILFFLYYEDLGLGMLLCKHFILCLISRGERQADGKDASERSYYNSMFYVFLELVGELLCCPREGSAERKTLEALKWEQIGIGQGMMPKTII
jgi:hypothetical protein